VELRPELAFQFLAEQGFDFRRIQGPSALDHLVHAQLHNRKARREERRTLACDRRLGRLQGDR
jgi:hypothetical protein